MADEETYIRMADIHEELLCTICFLNPKNKIIDCGNHHSFCEECITKWRDTNQHTCPLCRGQFCIPQGGPKNFPENHTVQSLMGKLKELEGEGVNLPEDALCAECTEPRQPATAVCNECGNICKECVADHQKKRIFTNHVVQGLGGSPDPQPMTRMGLILKDVEDKTISLIIHVAATLKELKDLIYEKTGTPANQQWLMCCGRSLNGDDKELQKDLNIKSDATIQLMLRGLGGRDSIVSGLSNHSNSIPLRFHFVLYPVLPNLL